MEEAREQGPGVSGMSTREAAWLAWYLCAVSLTLTVLGLFLLVVSRSPAGAPLDAGGPVFDYWLENTVVVISFSTVGAVIAPRLPPRNPVGGLFCAIGMIQPAHVSLWLRPNSASKKDEVPG